MRSPLAGLPAPPGLLVDLAALERGYFGDPAARVSFGTSGHRGTALDGSFTERHILAITQAIIDYRRQEGIGGPLFLGRDTHAASRLAARTAVEVLAANGVPVVAEAGDGFTATPVISRAILVHNATAAPGGLADGIVITPSHNPPEDGGLKYNPPHGGPADTGVTSWIEARANAGLQSSNREVRRTARPEGRDPAGLIRRDLTAEYVADLGEVIAFEPIRGAGLRLGVDPLGGASLACWGMIAERYGLNLEVVNPQLDPRFGFMRVDHDGRIRMDCSSPDAMAGLVELRARFDVACGADPDADRHGIVTPSLGLLNPNHYLAVAIRYLLTTRTRWPAAAAVGKTLVSSALIDRVTADLGRRLLEVPVGFKWFSPGLLEGSLCFGGEESAGATFLRMNGSAWTTDKDGILLGLLAAEITAATGRDPGEHYRELAGRLGAPHYTRIDTPCTAAEKAAFSGLTPAMVTAVTLAGDPIESRLTRAPGNGAAIGGLKVTTPQGWFAARPSGTENVYKLYAESFRDEAHLAAIVSEATALVRQALAADARVPDSSTPP